MGGDSTTGRGGAPGGGAEVPDVAEGADFPAVDGCEAEPATGREGAAAAPDAAARLTLGAGESGGKTDATGRGVGLETVDTDAAAGLAGGAEALWTSPPVRASLNSPLIRSTVGGSRLASALTLTSSPHSWIRSSSSWLFSPSSFANS